MLQHTMFNKPVPRSKDEVLTHARNFIEQYYSSMRRFVLFLFNELLTDNFDTRSIVCMGVDVRERMCVKPISETKQTPTPSSPPIGFDSIR